MQKLLVAGVESGAIPVALFFLYWIVSWGNALRLQKQVYTLLKQVQERSPETYETAVRSRYKWLTLFTPGMPKWTPDWFSVRNVGSEGLMQFLEGAELDDVASIAHQKKVVSYLLKVQQRFMWFPVFVALVGLLSFAAVSAFPYIKGLVYVLEK